MYYERDVKQLKFLIYLWAKEKFSQLGAVEISEGFNNLFANLGPDLAKTIKGTKKLFFDFLSQGTDENFDFCEYDPSYNKWWS